MAREDRNAEQANKVGIGSIGLIREASSSVSCCAMPSAFKHAAAVQHAPALLPKSGTISKKNADKGRCDVHEVAFHALGNEREEREGPERIRTRFG